MTPPVGLDVTYALDPQPTGVAVYSRELMTALAAIEPEREFGAYVRLHRFRRSLSAPFPPAFRRRPLFDLLAPATGIFHGLNQRLPARKRGRFAVTFHDLFVMTADYSTPGFKAKFARQAREAAARADLVICVSRFTAGQVQELLSVESGRIRVIPHGVGPVAPTTSSEKVLLHVGAIQERKNLVRLIEAFEQLEGDWRLVLAGGSGYGADRVLQKINVSPARERIVITGYVDPQALEAWWARARLFVFPSLDEGFGIPILEAMARGIPVVTSARSATLEIGQDAAVLVDPFSAESIADGIRLAETQRESWIRRGLIRSRNFSWDRAARETWAVYRELGLG